MVLVKEEVRSGANGTSGDRDGELEPAAETLWPALGSPPGGNGSPTEGGTRDGDTIEVAISDMPEAF